MKVEVMIMEKKLNINSTKIKALLKAGVSITLITSMIGCTVKEKEQNPAQEPTVTEETKDPQVNEPSSDSKSEGEVVEYFDQLKEQFANISEINAEDIKDWSFDRLVDTVDFVNNKKPIGGIYFKEMTGTAKGAVVGTLNFMDETLMNVYPDYKEKAAEVFGIAKEKLSEFKNSIEDAIGDQIGHDRYNEIKQNVKDKASELWDKTKEYGSKAKESFESWYNEQKEKRR